jgi:hypothetical protein
MMKKSKGLLVANKTYLKKACKDLELCNQLLQIHSKYDYRIQVFPMDK